jgi:hypothetical protein
MAISARSRRRIEVDEGSYLWWVAEHEDACGTPVLTVVSEDKHFLVKYQLLQSDDVRHVVVLGRDFRKRTDCGGRWRRFRCPAFGTLETVTPKGVAALVRWCKEGSDALVEVDWRGKLTGDGGA